MENEEISLRDVYERLWACRDFEISHLWQRSVFLAAFLGIVWTGYGRLAMLFIEKSKETTHLLRLHAAACVVACLVMIVSTLWICMAKASKAWQERYENAINDFMEKVSSKNGFRALFVSQYAGFEFENLASEKIRRGRSLERERNRAPWRTGGSNYSPSRINVVIGQLSWIVSFFLAAVHLVGAFHFGTSGGMWQRLLCVALAAGFALTLALCGFLTLGKRWSPIASSCS